MNVSQPPPPDTTGELPPKWGAEYQQRTGDIPDDGSPAVDDRDTADLIDPEAADPTPTEVSPDDPDHVDPDDTARPVDASRLERPSTVLLGDGAST